MGFFSKKPETPVDPTLQPDEWIAASEARYRDKVNAYYGSPETMARGGQEALEIEDFGTAMFFFRKSIDIIHSQVGGPSPRRVPGPADDPILFGFIMALEASLARHPGAPVDESVREVTHRMRSISTQCRNTGLDPQAYDNALMNLARIAPDVRVDDILWT
jgi:hypothetical protein